MLVLFLGHLCEPEALSVVLKPRVWLAAAALRGAGAVNQSRFNGAT